MVAGQRREGLGAAWWWVTAVVSFFPLIWRRRYPIPAFVLVAAVAVLSLATDARQLSAAVFAALWLALYSVAVQESRRAALAAAGVFEVWGVAAVAVWAPGYAIPPAFVLVSGTATAGLMIGVNQQTRRAYLAALEERAARLEYERDQQGQLAAATERTRIAREVHDIVTHSLSVMVALADGAAVSAETAPRRAGAAMRQVAATGRQAIGEMHRIVGTLRTDGDDPESHPAPGLGDIEELLSQVRAAGLAVRFTVQGQPRQLPPGEQLAVYRIIQECLTNVRKHAADVTAATVTLRYGLDGIEVQVSDDGHPGRTASTEDGHGITGMRERAAAYGGSVTAGPRPGGGWLVRAGLNSGGSR